MQPLTLSLIQGVVNTFVIFLSRVLTLRLTKITLNPPLPMAECYAVAEFNQV